MNTEAFCEGSLQATTWGGACAGMLRFRTRLVQRDKPGGPEEYSSTDGAATNSGREKETIGPKSARPASNSPSETCWAGGTGAINAVQHAVDSFVGTFSGPEL